MKTTDTTNTATQTASLKLPVNRLDKLFITHLHADHMGDILTLSGSFSKVGRADGPIHVWGPPTPRPRRRARCSAWCSRV